jgi:hypothetical protein
MNEGAVIAAGTTSTLKMHRNKKHLSYMNGLVNVIQHIKAGTYYVTTGDNQVDVDMKTFPLYASRQHVCSATLTIPDMLPQATGKKVKQSHYRP